MVAVLSLDPDPKIPQGNVVLRLVNRIVVDIELSHGSPVLVPAFYGHGLERF